MTEKLIVFLKVVQEVGYKDGKVVEYMFDYTPMDLEVGSEIEVTFETKENEVDGIIRLHLDPDNKLVIRAYNPDMAKKYRELLSMIGDKKDEEDSSATST